MECLSLGFGSFELEVALDRMESNLNSLHGGAARLNADTVTGDGRAEAASVIRPDSPMLLSHRHPAGEYGARSESGPSRRQIPSRRESARFLA